MVRQIKDCQNHVVCLADSMSGVIENKFKNQTIRTRLPIGECMDIVRGDTITFIKRMETGDFNVYSRLMY